MSRRRLAIRPVAKKLSLPSDLVASVEAKLFDPTRAKPVYGGLSGLVTELLEKWNSEVETPLPSELLGEIKNEHS